MTKDPINTNGNDGGDEIKPGDEIHFLRDLIEGEHPGITFVSKGSVGVIDKVGGAQEGFWVSQAHHPSFGCRREDFELINLTQKLFISKLLKFTSCSDDVLMRVHPHTIATDKSALVWVASNLAGASFCRHPEGIILGAIQKHKEAIFKGITFSLPAAASCSSCDGQGTIMPNVTCDECHGDGEVYFNSEKNKYKIICKSCNGSGSVKSKAAGDERKCNDCVNGESLCEPISVDGVFVNPSYLRLIELYPDVKFSALKINKKDALGFTSSNKINGIIMGLSFNDQHEATC